MPWQQGWLVNVLNSISRIVYYALDEVLGRAFPWRRFIIAPRVRPHAFHQQGGRAGIEPAKPCTPPRQSSVFPYVSKGPTKLWPENRGEPRLGRYVTRQRHAPVGLAPTSPDPMYSEPAVGLYSMGDEVMARALLYPLSYAPRISCESRSGWTRTNNRCTLTGSRLFSYQSRPNEVVTHFITALQAVAVPASSSANLIKCPRQESNLVLDLRRVACDPQHSENMLFPSACCGPHKAASRPDGAASSESAS
jgi:hypothetical protein